MLPSLLAIHLWLLDHRRPIGQRRSFHELRTLSRRHLARILSPLEPHPFAAPRFITHQSEDAADAFARRNLRVRW